MATSDIAATQDELRERLSKTHLGAGLPDADAAKLASIARLIRMPASEIVIREGEETPFLGVVASGRFAMRTHVADRGDVTYMTVEIGDIFGWSTLTPPHNAHASVVALTEAEAVCLPAHELRSALAADPSLGSHIYERVLRTLGRRLTVTRIQLLDLFEQSPRHPGLDSGGPA